MSRFDQLSKFAESYRGLKKNRMSLLNQLSKFAEDYRARILMSELTILGKTEARTGNMLIMITAIN